jgi:hypothetical protein
MIPDLSRLGRLLVVRFFNAGIVVEAVALIVILETL